MLSFQASKVSDCGATVKPPVHNESDFTPFSHTVEDPDFLFDGQQTAANYDSTAFVSSILSDQFPSAIINLDDLNLDQVKRHYYVSHTSINPTQVVPEGPVIDLTAPHDRDRLPRAA